jgi:Cu-Zn family superoxide dismutase
MRGLTDRSRPVTVCCPLRWRYAVVMVTVAAALIPTACAYKGFGVDNAVTLRGEGVLTAPAASSRADTYNPELAPLGARLAVTMTPSGGSTTVELTVSGMLPNRGYAAHAHTNACNVDPASAGPHYQNRIDPAATQQTPSTNPEFANPTNEIWLDFRTNGSGSSSMRTTVPFVFTERGPGSVVVHEAMQTATGPGQAGTAGARIACLTLTTAGFHPLT